MESQLNVKQKGAFCFHSGDLFIAANGFTSLMCNRKRGALDYAGGDRV